MALFGHNRNTNILITIEYINVLLSCNYSLETIFVKVAEKKFWGVSPIFARVLKRVKKGSSLNESMTIETNNTHHKNTKRLLETLNTGAAMKLQPILEQLSGDIMEHKNLTMENLLDDLGKGLNRMMILISFPLMLFFVHIAQEAVEGIGLDITPYLKFIPVLLVVDVVLLIIVLFMMRFKE